MRHWLAYIMLTIFSFQILPIKEIGRIIFKAQMTEEVHEHADSDEEVFLNFKRSVPLTFEAPSFLNSQLLLEQQVALAIQKATIIAHQHFPDIFVPPPNASFIG